MQKKKKPIKPRRETQRRAGLRSIRAADNRGQVAFVVELCREHLKAWPMDSLAWVHYGMALSQLSLHKKALSAFTKCLACCSSERRHLVWGQIGFACEKAGDFRTASKWFQRALKAAPEDATYHIFCGHNAHRQGGVAEAIKHYQRATTCSKGYVDEAWFNLGGIYLMQREYIEAKNCYERALLIDPQYRLAKARLKDVLRTLEFLGRK